MKMCWKCPNLECGKEFPTKLEVRRHMNRFHYWIYAATGEGCIKVCIRCQKPMKVLKIRRDEKGIGRNVWGCSCGD